MENRVNLSSNRIVANEKLANTEPQTAKRGATLKREVGLKGDWVKKIKTLGEQKRPQ